MCFTAIPGKTGCLAMLDVPPPTRRKTIYLPPKAVAPKKAAVAAKVVAPKKAVATFLPNDVPRFHGRPLVKTFLTWDELERKDDRKRVNCREYNNRQHTRSSSFYKSHRTLNRMRFGSMFLSF